MRGVSENADFREAKLRKIKALEADIQKLSEKYFDVFYKEDKNPNPDRKRDAEAMAEKYPEKFE